MPVTCPAGHTSSTADYCDVCGVAIDPSAAAGSAAAPGDPAPATGAPATGAPAPASPATAAPGPVTDDRCPDCGTPRGPDDAFCEVCGLDFATGARPAPPPPPAPAAPADPAAPVAAPATPAAAAPAPVPTGWTAVVEVDPDFFATNQPDDAATTLTLPAGTPPREIPLTADEILVGRAKGGGPDTPAIDLGVAPEDPGVSHRHARLTRRGDGWVLVDLGSTNGTRVGAGTDPIAPGTEVPLADGAQVLLGVWTRITLRHSGTAGGP